ncbi:hypothetical protein ACIPRI_22785 [Variovorax sp. LARHSF232]
MRGAQLDFLFFGSRCLRWLLALSIAYPLLAAHALAQASPRAEALLTRHSALQSQLAASVLGRPLLIESEELPEGLRGEVFAEVEQPFAQVAQALAQPSHWCEMLLLHVNNRRCKLIKGEGGAPALELAVVRRYDLSVESAFILPLAVRVDRGAPDYLVVELSSESGPMGTSSHQVRLEAVALPGTDKSFLHFSYSYQHTALARMATQAYLATFGRHKVGFTVLGQSAQDGPDYIRGLRGLVERNAVRYFLTVEAYLDAMRASPAQQAERRLENWYAGSERYPRQLHEIDRATYLAIKRADRSAAPVRP